jgi:uncharacterized protein (DUF1697 family)
MARFVVFLRAINVGGRYLKMADLARHFHEMGHADALTFISSGNVLFGSRRRDADALAREIETGLAPRLGFVSEAFVRSAAQVQALATWAAAQRQPQGPAADVNVIFLPQALSVDQQARVAALRNDVDDFVSGERELLWLCRRPQSQSRFSGATLERQLKLRCTVRRATMLQGLARLLQDAPGPRPD